MIDLKKINPAWISASVAFILLFSASFASYFGAIASIKEQIAFNIKEEHNYTEKKFATKEEYGFIKEILLEVKQDVKDIKKQNHY